MAKADFYEYGNNIDQKEAEVYEVYEDPKVTKRTTKRPYCEFSEEAKKSKFISFLDKVRNQRFRIVRVKNILKDLRVYVFVITDSF